MSVQGPAKRQRGSALPHAASAYRHAACLIGMPGLAFARRRTAGQGDPCRQPVIRDNAPGPVRACQGPASACACRLSQGLPEAACTLPEAAVLRQAGSAAQHVAAHVLRPCADTVCMGHLALAGIAPACCSRGQAEPLGCVHVIAPVPHHEHRGRVCPGLG